MPAGTPNGAEAARRPNRPAAKARVATSTTPAKPGCAPARFPLRLFLLPALPAGRRPGGGVAPLPRGLPAAIPTLPFAIEPVQIPWRHDIPLEGYVLRTTSPSAALGQAARARQGAEPCGYDSPVEESTRWAATRPPCAASTSSPSPDRARPRCLRARPPVPFRFRDGGRVGDRLRRARGAKRRPPRRHAPRNRRPQLRRLPRAARRLRDPRIGALAADPAQTDMAPSSPNASRPSGTSSWRGRSRVNEKISAAFPGIRGQEFWLTRLPPTVSARRSNTARRCGAGLWMSRPSAARPSSPYGEGDPIQVSSAAFSNGCPIPTSAWLSTAMPTAAVGTARA